METTTETLGQALEGLPINALIAIAAELDAGVASTEQEETKEAIDLLMMDLLKVGANRLGSYDNFMQAVDWWYKSHNSREWYQKIQRAFEDQAPS